MREQIIQGTAFAAVLAVLLNVVVYLLGASQNVGFMVMRPGRPAPQPVSLLQIIALSLALIVLAGAVLWVLDRLTDAPLMIFLWTAAAAALLSLVLLYAFAVGTATFALLGLIHIITVSSAALGMAIFFQHRKSCL